jgi:hypothetical protein
MRAMGYCKRSGFLAGLAGAQIREFWLIFVAMGVRLGHVGADALGIVTVVGLFTIAASPHMITYSHRSCSALLALTSLAEDLGRGGRVAKHGARMVQLERQQRACQSFRLSQRSKIRQASGCARQ